MKLVVRFIVSIGMVGALGCASNKTPEPVFVHEYYSPAFRQLPPEPVYNRLTWSHLPEPITTLSTKQKVPSFQPVISIALPDSTLGEAVEAISQTIGYEGKYPVDIADRAVSLSVDGSLEDILSELARQAGVSITLDHRERMIRVF